MAQIVLTDCFISLDGVEYSDVGTNVAISYSAAAVDFTPFGSDTTVNRGGVKEWAMEMELIADEATNGQALFDLVGTVIPVEVRPSGDLVSADNPSYEGSALVADYTPLSGSHGDASKVSLSLVCSGPLSRNIV